MITNYLNPIFLGRIQVSNKQTTKTTNTLFMTFILNSIVGRLSLNIVTALVNFF